MSKALLITICVSACVVGCTSSRQMRADANRSGTEATSSAYRLSCIRNTATRIPLKEHECATTPGRIYSKDDIDRTGATTAGGALRLLDPAITVGH